MAPDRRRHGDGLMPIYRSRRLIVCRRMRQPLLPFHARPVAARPVTLQSACFLWSIGGYDIHVTCECGWHADGVSGVLRAYMVSGCLHCQCIFFVLLMLAFRQYCCDFLDIQTNLDMYDVWVTIMTSLVRQHLTWQLITIASPSIARIIVVVSGSTWKGAAGCEHSSELHITIHSKGVPECCKQLIDPRYRETRPATLAIWECWSRYAPLRRPICHGNQCLVTFR